MEQIIKIRLHGHLHFVPLLPQGHALRLRFGAGGRAMTMDQNTRATHSRRKGARICHQDLSVGRTEVYLDGCPDTLPSPTSLHAGSYNRAHASSTRRAVSLGAQWYPGALSDALT